MSDFDFYKKQGYRPCVGMVVLNKEQKILMGERLDIKNAWQMPQGGVLPTETSCEAAYRELKEETGISEKDLIFADQTSRIYTYDFPGKTALQKFNGKYKGQAQQWFLFNFVGDNSSINIFQPEQEFVSWRWESPINILNIAADFKKDIYKEVFYDFCISVR